MIKKINEEITRLIDELESKKAFYEKYELWGEVPRLKGQLDMAYRISYFIESLESVVTSFKSIWHDSNEEQPKSGSNVVVWSDNYMVSLNNVVFVNPDRKWAYYNDIVNITYPQAKK